MPEKRYRIENLDCANCGAKAEEKIRKIPGVEAASITFATMQLRITAADPDALLPLAQKAASEVEPDIRFVPIEGCHREEHSYECGCGHHHHEEHTHECGCGHHNEEHSHECGCGHHHEEHSHECDCGHHHHEEKNGELPQILLGTGLFAAGLLLSLLLPNLPFLSTLIFVAAYGVLGWKVLYAAGRNLVRGRVLDENFLMSIATLGAFVIGEPAEAVGVMLFYRVGEYFEHRAMERSRSQIMAAVDLRPEVVTRLEGEARHVIPADTARPGDLLLVLPGERIPLDSIVISGESRMDTSAVNGEPVPMGVRPGDAVISGWINMTGQLTVRAEKPLSESMVSRILQSVENAAASKPKIDRFITRFARVYTPVVVGAAVVTAVIPGLITGDWNYWVYTALSWLVMSCPCALVLSVPLAFFSGIGTGSKRGILFKSGQSIEALARIRAVVMDKTGTVTRGDFTLQQPEEDLLALCAACEQFSTHPIAQSIVEAARQREMTLGKPDAVEEIAGEGIRGELEGSRVLCGNEKLLRRFGVEFPAQSGAGTGVLIARDGKYLGCLRIGDTVKPGAKEAVSRLKKMGMKTALLTGDREESAIAVAEAVGIDSVHARLLPDEKLDRLKAIREQVGAVMFVGDGINDAPVLAGADVGAAMGSGADAAIEAADVVFMTPDIAAVPEAVEIARQTRNVAWQNVVFALAVKAAVMVLGMMGLASMWAAVFADSGVAMLCVLNSIRMLYRKEK